MVRVDIDYVDHNGTGDPNYVDMGAYESPEIWFVDRDANAGSNDGKSWENAFTDLRYALSKVKNGYEMWVAEGTYKPDDVNDDRSISFNLVSGVGVYGGFAGTEIGRHQRNWTAYTTILSGDIGTPDYMNDNSYHVVKGADDAVLDGFTITGGNANGGYPTPESWGGGMYNDRSSPTVTHCMISGNSANAGGGGMYNQWNSSPAVTNCIFHGNSTFNVGGGMHNNGYYGFNAPIVTNCTFSGNSAGYGGGGMRNSHSSPTLINCTFSGNSSSSEGGGMYNYYISSLTVTNCIFWGNDAGTSGDEIYNYSSSSNPTFRYCDVNGCGGSENWDPNFGTDLGGNIDSNPCFLDINDPAGPDGIFGTFDDGLRLMSSSPCIDAADGDIAPPEDILGIERVDVNDVNNTGTGDPNYADMGAYEFADVYNITKDKYYHSIQSAIDDANGGDTIVVSSRTYYETIDFKGKAITLTSIDPNDPDIVASTIIDANNTSVDVVKLNSGENANSILDGITITGGRYGIYCYDSSPVITNCAIKGNNSHGIYVAQSNSSPEITNCRIEDNQYGLYCDDHSLPTVSGCTIINNKSYGVYCYYYGKVNLKNCVIAKNKSYGVYQHSGTPTDSNIINCTIYNNKNVGILGSSEEVTNCIIWGNGNDLYGCESVTTYCCIEDDDPGLGNFKADPCFVNSDANNFHLDANSRCIDAGAPWSNYSQEPTPNGSRANLGAYGNTSEATTTIDADADGISDAWERYFWPGDDPNQHDPNENLDGDSFSNWSEYLFGYEADFNDANEPMLIVQVVLSASQFDPTKGETVTIYYWLNMDANAAVSFTNTDTNETVRVLEKMVAAGANDAEWNGKDSNGLIVEDGFYDILIDANDGAGHDANSEPGTVEVYYVHGINDLKCNPYRILPLNNEVSKITYDLTTDANMVVTIYDPCSVLFATLVDDEFQTEGSQELMWYGRDKDPNDPNSMYISKEGYYLIRVKFVGMREKEEAAVTAYK